MPFRLFDRLARLREMLAPSPFERRGPRAGRDRHARLALTALEDRTVPTTVTIAKLADLTEGDGATAVFRLTRDSTAGMLMVNVTASGTAMGGSGTNDYSFIFSPVMFGYGQATADVTVTPIDDSTSEPTETIILTIASGSGYTVGTQNSATAHLYDNDAQVVTVEALNDAVEDDATTGNTDGRFQLTRTGDLSGALTVNVTVGGTATSGTDFTALGSTVTFAANAATATVSVNALHDGVADADETVSLTVGSGSGYSVGSTASASLTIIDTTMMPQAFDGWVTTSKNDPVVVAVLDLATDLDGDTLTVDSVTQGSHGSVAINGNGTVTYTPGTNYVGDDTFTYTVEDPFGNTSTGTITVNVTAPVAPPTSVWTATNTAVTVAVLDMAFDPDEDTLTTTAVTQGANGSVVINVDGSVTYTPNSTFTGDDSFTYTVEDPDGNEATNTVTVTVGPIDPVALDDEVATPVNTAVVIDSEDVAFDPAGDALTVTAVTQGANGTVVINMDGTFTYTPSTNYSGTDSFIYTVRDASFNTSTGTITVVVGTTAPTDADELIDDLEEMENLIDNYDEDTPDALLDLLPNLLADSGTS